jgi:hypothetical protein
MTLVRFFSRLHLALFLPLAGLLLFSAEPAGSMTEQSTQAIPKPTQTDLFIGGEGGYHSYRIPALIATPQGAPLRRAQIFAEILKPAPRAVLAARP